MADIKSGTEITADGTYDIKVETNELYKLVLLYNAGTGSVTVSQGHQTTRGLIYQQETLPNSTSTLVVSATGTRRSFEILTSGTHVRLVVASASSLSLFPLLTKIGRGA